MITQFLYIWVMNKIINRITLLFRVKIQQRWLHSCTWQNKKKIKRCYHYLWLWLQLSKRYRKQKLKLRNQPNDLSNLFFLYNSNNFFCITTGLCKNYGQCCFLLSARHYIFWTVISLNSEKGSKVIYPTWQIKPKTRPPTKITHFLLLDINQLRYTERIKLLWNKITIISTLIWEKFFIMDPSFVSFDSSALNELSSRTAHYSQADISKALAILGFGSWASIEPSK